jgi:hypothetical protein
LLKAHPSIVRVPLDADHIRPVVALVLVCETDKLESAAVPAPLRIIRAVASNTRAEEIVKLSSSSDPEAVTDTNAKAGDIVGFTRSSEQLLIVSEDAAQPNSDVSDIPREDCTPNFRFEKVDVKLVVTRLSVPLRPVPTAIGVPTALPLITVAWLFDSGTSV